MVWRFDPDPLWTRAGDQAAGWALGWRINLWARLGDGAFTVDVAWRDGKVTDCASAPRNRATSQPARTAW
jgi:hypothetical protein